MAKAPADVRLPRNPGQATRQHDTPSGTRRRLRGQSRQLGDQPQALQAIFLARVDPWLTPWSHI